MRRELWVVLAIAACDRAPTTKPPPPAVAARPPLAEKASFRIDVGASSPCTSGTRCEARLVLTALAGYKVNEEYPFKFVGDASADVELDGTGAFAIDDTHRGTMTIGFRAVKAGTVRLSGAFKLSVCTADLCAIEAPKIAFDVAAI